MNQLFECVPLTSDEHLERYYEKVFQFQVLDSDDFYIPLEPGYDGGCKFMYRLL